MRIYRREKEREKEKVRVGERVRTIKGLAVYIYIAYRIGGHCVSAGRYLPARERAAPIITPPGRQNG